jgi:hypothetical protein
VAAKEFDLKQQSQLECLGIVALLLLVLLTFASVGQAETVLEVGVIDTSVTSSTVTVEIPVYLKNYSDTVAGFALWFQLNRPDLISLHSEIVTSGTLVENWEYLDSRHLSGQPYELKVVGIANMPPAPLTPGIPPQLGTLPLLKIIADVGNIPDTLQDRTVVIQINHDQLFHFNFSDPSGNSIGTIVDSVLDTAYYHCLSWQGDSCLDWELFYEPQSPEDSLYIYWDLYSYLDSASVVIIDGSLTVSREFVCGDLDGSGSGPDISDLIYLVGWMFSGGPPPVVMASADCNGSTGVDIADLVCFVSYMFQGGPSPDCAQ